MATTEITHPEKPKTPTQQALIGIKDILTKYPEKPINELKKTDIPLQDRKDLLDKFRKIEMEQAKNGLTSTEKSFLKQFKNGYKDFIQENLSDIFTQQINSHLNDPIHNIRRSLLASDKGLAKMLGLDKDPLITSLLFTRRQTERRILLGAGIGMFGAFTAAGAYGVVNYFNKENPQAPKSPSTPKPEASPGPTVAPTMPARTSPTTDRPSPPPQALDNSYAISRAANSIAETPPIEKPTTTEPEKSKEILPPRQNKWGFMVSSPEAIEALPPSIGVIRIDGDSNLMYPDGRFHHNPDHYYEEMLKAADKKGLEVIFAYKASWFPGIDARTLQDGDLEKSSPIIKNHMRTILKHPSVRYLEVGNEVDQNIKVPGKDDQFWEGSMTDYAKLFKLVEDNLDAIQKETGSNAELIISSFADPMSTQQQGKADAYFDELNQAFKDLGVDTSKYLVAGHAYHSRTLDWILNNLQTRIGAKGIIITEYNVNKNQTDPPPEVEVAEMVKKIDEIPGLVAIAHEFKPKKAPGNDYALTDNDPRYQVIMKTVDDEMQKPEAGQTQQTDTAQESLPSKGERIHHPSELTYQEVRPWVGKMRSTHDAVLTESLFTKELASLNKVEREKVIDAISNAHAQSLYEHYGNVDAIVGLDPGHGGTDVGSGATGIDGKVLAEKNLTWEIATKTADKLYELSKGKYQIVFLRPENPKDEDLDKDGNIAAVERIQKRKAQLLKMEQELRPDPNDRGRNIVYCSIHLNGSPNGGDSGTEVYSPNDMAMSSETYRTSSQKLANLLQDKLVESIRAAGYQTLSRGAKIDPDSRPPGPNSDRNVGPYNVLDSPKLDRVLAA